MRLFIPIAMIAIFVFYILYLAFYKKDLKRNLATVVYPGAFFMLVWGVCYMAFLR